MASRLLPATSQIGVLDIKIKINAIEMAVNNIQVASYNLDASHKKVIIAQRKVAVSKLKTAKDAISAIGKLLKATNIVYALVGGATGALDARMNLIGTEIAEMNAAIETIQTRIAELYLKNSWIDYNTANLAFGQSKKKNERAVRKTYIIAMKELGTLEKKLRISPWSKIEKLIKYIYNAQLTLSMFPKRWTKMAIVITELYNVIEIRDGAISDINKLEARLRNSFSIVEKRSKQMRRLAK